MIRTNIDGLSSLIYITLDPALCYLFYQYSNQVFTTSALIVSNLSSMLYTALLYLIAIHLAITSTVSDHNNSTTIIWTTTFLPILDSEQPTIYIDAVIKIDIDNVLEDQSQSQSQSQDQNLISNSCFNSTFRNSGYVYKSISIVRLMRTVATDSSSDYSVSNDSQYQTEQSFLSSQDLLFRSAPESENQITVAITSSTDISVDISLQHSRIGDLRFSDFLKILETAFL